MKLRAYLCPNLTFRRGPTSYKVLKVENDQRLLVETQIGNVLTLPLLQFLEEYREGHIFDLRSENIPTAPIEKNTPVTLSARWDRASEKSKKRAQRAWDYIAEIEKAGPVIFDTFGNLETLLKDACISINDEKAPSRSTFFEWHKRFIAGGRSIEALLMTPHPYGLNHRKSRLHNAVVEILEQQLQAFQTGKFKRVGKEWTSEINHLINEKNCHLPPLLQIPEITVSTWNRHVSGISPFIHASIQNTKAIAKRQFSPVTQTEEPEFPLQIVEIDHARLNISIYDSSTGKCHGEVWMTTMVCRKTKVILGFTLHIARWDQEVAARCFVMAALPKTDFKKWCPEAIHDWPCFGLPSLLLCDNGSEFLSKGFKEFCARAGCSIAFAPVRSPQWKGSIERYHRTIKQGVLGRLTGAVRRARNSTAQQKPSKLRDALTMNELTQVIAKWIVDIYHQETHSSLGMSPIEAWKRSRPSIYVSLIRSVDDLLVRTGRKETRQLKRTGIEFQSDFYHSAELAELFEQIGPTAEKIQFVSHSNSAYKIYVQHPLRDEYFPAFNQNPGCRPEYSREQWDSIREKATEQGLNVKLTSQRDTASALVESENEKLRIARKADRRDIARKARSNNVDSSKVMYGATREKQLVTQSKPDFVVDLDALHLPDINSILASDDMGGLHD